MKYFLILMIVCSQVFAIEATVPGTKNKVNVKADRGSFKQKENRIELYDNVEAVDDKMIVNCDEMTINLLAKPKGSEGQGTSRKAKNLIAEKNVIIRDEGMKATGDRAVYKVAEKKLYLTGNAVVEQRDLKTGKVNVYKATRIIYHKDTKQIDFENLNADMDKPKEEKKDAPKP